MKIAIISDTHDNLPNFKKALEWIKKNRIKVLIHCGDISTTETLKEALRDFSGKTYFVFGNMDFDRLQIRNDISKNLPQVQCFNDIGELEIDKKKIAFSHFTELAKKLAKSKKYDIVFYGHSHKPWQEKIGKTRLVNPGNLAGLFYKPTFAIYDTKSDKLELKILEKLK